MSTVKLAKFTSDDDDSLRDLTEAARAREDRLPTATALDFAGVTGVTPTFLDELFRGRLPAEVRALRLLNLDPSVRDAVDAWMARLPTPTVVTPAPSRRVAPSFAASTEVGEKYTPSRLMRRLREQLTRYLEAAWPLNDTRLVRSRRALFEHEHGGRLLAQDPFVETTPRYTPFDGTFRDLSLPAPEIAFLESLAARRLIFPSLYEHQARALSSYLGPERENLIVATGTGSGKTECFLLPMVAQLHEEARTRPASWKRRGIRALVLYPMNALVNDQVARLRRLVGDEGFAAQFRDDVAGRHPVFGMYTGRTPYAGARDPAKDRERVAPLLRWYLTMEREQPELAAHLRALGRFPAKDLAAFLAEDLAEPTVTKSGKNKGKARTKHHWDLRLRTGPHDRELLTRQEMVWDAETQQGASPDILVTNYSMLEYMLMRPFERPLFEETRAWLAEPGNRFLLVLDEAHMYRGAKGAEVAFLLRRLFDRLGVTEQPDKVSMIATSASLGDGADARDVARRFAADLSGLAPDRFAVVTGRRLAAKNPSPGDASLAAVLAGVDLEALHRARGGSALSDVLAPVFTAVGEEIPTGDEGEVLAALHRALAPQGFLQQVLDATSGAARSLDALAATVFPDAADARRATEVLLTLGAVARTEPDAPGLLPTRVHLMFRGIDGLHACINPHCLGRQDGPGELAPLGKLFATARTHCDACGSRVFEVASCRECGGAYALAFAPTPDLSRWDFLWGESAAEHGEAVQLLPGVPRSGHDHELITVQLRTGNLVPADHDLPRDTVRDFLIPTSDGRRVSSFTACPLCQPPGSQRRNRIRDHRTRGEQPFTALIETQFAEQPPQSDRADLPNRGRKVLVFSDGRQKAARLAPALAVGHAQDAFRQVMLLATKALASADGVAPIAHLYPATLHVCAARAVDLFPDGGPDDRWRDDLRTAADNALSTLQQMPQLQPTLAFAQALFNEVTERFLSITQLGVGGYGVFPAIAGSLLRNFPAVGLSPEAQRILLDRWIRVQLERRCVNTAGASLGRLGEEHQRPEGITPGKRIELLPQRFTAYLRALLVDEARVESVARWFESLLRTGLFEFVNNEHFLRPAMLAIRLRPEGPWWACARCHRMHPDALGDVCDECGDSLAPADPAVLSARAGYYRDAVLRALSGSSLEPFGLTVKEHTAQLTGLDRDDDAFSITERYELRFQDLRVDNEAPIDVLSCTTTMEVGIDIGALSGVALRNVPPHVANYQQRAGRAGRRGRAIASVLTYAQGGSHDAWFYEDPSRIVSGAVRPPVVYVENREVLRRHARAWLVQRFFHETVPADPESYALFESMGTVRDFLDARQPCSLARLAEWLTAREHSLLRDLIRWIPTHGHGANLPIDPAEATAGIVPELIALLRDALPHEDLSALDALDADTRAALERRLDENLLQTLIERAILPRYAFPTSTVAFWVPKVRGAKTSKWKLEFDYQPQRDLQVALTEFPPGRSLTIDGTRFVSTALYNPYQPVVARTVARRTSYANCRGCGFVMMGEKVDALGDCPVCGNKELFKRPFVRPEGFAPDAGVPREPDRGGTNTSAGETTPAKLEVVSVEAWQSQRFDDRLRTHVGLRELVVVNKGIGHRGFRICPECGYAEPEMGVGFSAPKLSGKGATKVHPHPTQAGRTCAGTAGDPVFLGHTFRTDVLLMRIRLEPPIQCAVADLRERSGAPGRAALTSFVEALGIAASRALQVDEGELAGNWNPVPNGDPHEADVYFYDLLPGGAGYTRQLRENLDLALDAMRDLLDGCDCASSCYRCLRHWGNQRLHGVLDRHLARALLDAIQRGVAPTVSPAERDVALAPLAETLSLRGHTVRREVAPTPDGAPVEVPLVVTLGDREVWIDVHHPLVDVERAPTPVMEAALAQLGEVVALDVWTLANALPVAVARIEGRG